MNKKEYEYILQEEKNLKNLSNSKLVEFMDSLSYEFEILKVDIIDKTYLLDNIENLYNKFLMEYNSRK